jgi:hypothetical protein
LQSLGKKDYSVSSNICTWGQETFVLFSDRLLMFFLIYNISDAIDISFIFMIFDTFSHIFGTCLQHFARYQVIDHEIHYTEEHTISADISMVVHTVLYLCHTNLYTSYLTCQTIFHGYAFKNYIHLYCKYYKKK